MVTVGNINIGNRVIIRNTNRKIKVIVNKEIAKTEPIVGKSDIRK